MLPLVGLRKAMFLFFRRSKGLTWFLGFCCLFFYICFGVWGRGVGMWSMEAFAPIASGAKTHSNT